MQESIEVKRVDGARRIKTTCNHDWKKDKKLSADGTYGFTCTVCGTTSKIRFQSEEVPPTVEDYERAL